MTAIETFEKELAALIGRPTSLRPFICQGSPLECEAFIVGYNAATNLGADFWDCWVPGFGFDMEKWNYAYRQARASSVTKTGRSKAPLSATRKRFQWIAEEANRSGRIARFLETNIYASPTARKKDLGREQRHTGVFDFLLAAVKPKVLLVHGADAAKHIRLAEAQVSKIITVDHLYNCSESAARKYGQEIAECLQSNKS